MKVCRDNKPTAKNSAGESRTENDKSDSAGNNEKNPVCPGNEIQYAFLNFHEKISSLSAPSGAKICALS
jgi:hypothetical protein